MSKTMGKEHTRLPPPNKGVKCVGRESEELGMKHPEWWTTRELNGDCIVMHVCGNGAEYHRMFPLKDSEVCPDCKKAVPDCLILGSKIGAL
jgi:hypothetical protein